MNSENATTPAMARLGQFLEEHERSIGWLSRETGIHYDKVRRIMQGRAMTLDEALALARVLGVPVETFADGNGACGDAK